MYINVGWFIGQLHEDSTSGKVKPSILSQLATGVWMTTYSHFEGPVIGNQHLEFWCTYSSRAEHTIIAKGATNSIYPLVS